MPKKPIPLKIELTGSADEPGGDKIVLLIEVLRTIAKDFGVVIDYPAMIYLDDASESPKGDDLEETSHDNNPVPNP